MSSVGKKVCSKESVRNRQCIVSNTNNRRSQLDIVISDWGNQGRRVTEDQTAT